MKNFKKLLSLLDSSEKKKALLLLLMIIIMAFLDTIGVASILPFVAVLTNPELVETNLILNSIFHFSKIIGVQNYDQFLFTLGLFFFVILIVSLVFKTFTTYAIIRFIRMREYSIAKKLIEGYLHQPYTWFLNRNSAELGKNILSEITQIVANGFIPIIELIAKGLIAITLIILLIVADVKLTTLVIFLVGGMYFAIFYLIRNFLRRIGNDRLKSNNSRFIAVSEAFGAAKEIKVSGLEEIYIKRFSDPARIFAKTTALSQVIAQLPRFVLEAIIFGGVMLIILYMMTQSNSLMSILPVFSLFIFAGYRLMPAIQQIYSSFILFTFVGPSLDKIHEDLNNLEKFEPSDEKEKLIFNKSICLKNIHFNYPNTSRTALKDLSINIKAKTTVGLVGSTGSGKTTTVDIILGLLEAQKGTLEVDGKVILKQNTRSWQRSIGYVPQNIYLADQSVAENIAFGVKTEIINSKAVEKASKIANLHNFVINELPNKYQTIIGERGVRLSGGQRQRIGIARALYHNPKVLILDEATSALDNQTEEAVMDAVNNLSKDITIILIAHRLNTVKKCDIIFKLEKGKIVGQGTFDELINESNNFNINKKTL